MATTVAARQWQTRRWLVYGDRFVAVPAFGANGLLPVGDLFSKDEQELYRGHPCTAAELRVALHDNFPLSVKRPVLQRELDMLFALGCKVLKFFALWISGAYATNTENPNDLFVVLQVPGDMLQRANALDNWLLSRLFDRISLFPGDDEDDDLKVQTAVCRAYPVGHPRHEIGSLEEQHARLFANYPLDHKLGGYLEIVHSAGGRVNSLDAYFANGTGGNGEPPTPE